MNATAHRFSSNDFAYMKADDTFYAEASTLGWREGNMVITSARTGASALFRWTGVHRDADGDIESFRFEGEGDAKGTKVVVYND